MLLAVLAPVSVVVAALVPAAWAIAPAAAVLLLLIALLDGALAGPLRGLDLAVPADGEVGQALSIGVNARLDRSASAPQPEAAIAYDPALGAEGRHNLSLSWDAQANAFTGTATLVPDRRGTAQVTGLWLRWAGPFGLAVRQVRRDLAESVRVWPDLSPTRSPILQSYLRDSQFGIVARRIRGEGTQFEALVEYEAGMDRRRIDWKASARHTALYARENEAERDNQIVFAFDCGQAMLEPLDGLSRLDRAITAGLMAGYTALKGGDRVAFFGFADIPLMLTPFITESRSFHRLQEGAAALEYTPREPNFTLALATLTARLKRRSLIVLFSEFTDSTSAQIMLESVERLVRHHVVIVVTVQDSELSRMMDAEPDSLDAIGMAVGADALAAQRQLVLARLQRLGVDVVDAPHDRIGYRLIDRYLATKRAGAIG